MPVSNPFRIILFVLLLAVSAGVRSQDYKAAVGVRFGYGWGVTAKGVLGKNGHVLEGMIRYGYHGLMLAQPGINFGCLYEKHFGFGRNRNWAVVLGGGPYIGAGKQSIIKIFSFGVGPILGMDVTAKRLPFNFTLDFKPCFYVDKYVRTTRVETDVTYYELGLSVRYAIP